MTSDLITNLRPVLFSQREGELIWDQSHKHVFHVNMNENKMNLNMLFFWSVMRSVSVTLPSVFVFSNSL